MQGQEKMELQKWDRGEGEAGRMSGQEKQVD